MVDSRRTWLRREQRAAGIDMEYVHGSRLPGLYGGGSAPGWLSADGEKWAGSDIVIHDRAKRAVNKCK